MTAKDWDSSKTTLLTNGNTLLKMLHEVGQRYVIKPSLMRSHGPFGWSEKKFMEQFNKCGELCKAHGMKVATTTTILNSAGTKVGGSNLFDFILKNAIALSW